MREEEYNGQNNMKKSKKMQNIDSLHQRVPAGRAGLPGSAYLPEKLTSAEHQFGATAAATAQLFEETAFR